MTTPHPLALSVTPSKFILPKGMLTITEKVTVTNAGTLPVKVTASPMTVSQSAGGCGVSSANPSLMTIPAIGRLAPGESRTVKVHVHAPAGTQADIAAVFAGAPAKAVTASSSGGTVSAAVAAQFIVNGKSRVTGPVCHPVAAVPAKGSDSLSMPLLGGLGGVLLAGAILAAVTARGWRRRHSQRHALATYESRPDYYPPDDNPYGFIP